MIAASATTVPRLMSTSPSACSAVLSASRARSCGAREPARRSSAVSTPGRRASADQNAASSEAAPAPSRCRSVRGARGLQRPRVGARLVARPLGGERAVELAADRGVGPAGAASGGRAPARGASASTLRGQRPRLQRVAGGAQRPLQARERAACPPPRSAAASRSAAAPRARRRGPRPPAGTARRSRSAAPRSGRPPRARAASAPSSTSVTSATRTRRSAAQLVGDAPPASRARRRACSAACARRRRSCRRTGSSALAQLLQLLLYGVEAPADVVASAGSLSLASARAAPNVVWSRRRWPGSRRGRCAVAVLLAGDLRAGDLAEQPVGAVGQLVGLVGERPPLARSVSESRSSLSATGPCPASCASTHSACSMRWKPVHVRPRDVVDAGVDRGRGCRSSRPPARSSRTGARAVANCLGLRDVARLDGGDERPHALDQRTAPACGT